MKLLLDTPVFLWFISGDKQLSEVIKTAICWFDNEVYLSMVDNIFHAYPIKLFNPS